MKSISFLMVALTLSACSKVSEGDAWSLQESEIISVSETPPPCGVIYALVEVKLKGKRGRTEVIYLPCVEVIDGPLPAVGVSCTAIGEWEVINSSIVNGSIREHPPKKVADELVCDGKKYVFDL